MYQEMGYGIVDQQETRRSGRSALLRAGHVVYCSGEFRGDGRGKKGQGGIGLSVRKSFPVPKYDHQSSSTTGH